MTPDDIARGIDDQDELVPIDTDDCTCDHLRCLEDSIFFGIDCPCPCHPTDIRESGIDDVDELSGMDLVAVNAEISFPKDQSRMFSIEDILEWARTGGWDVGQFEQENLTIDGDRAVIKGRLEVSPIMLIQTYGRGFWDLAKGNLNLRIFHDMRDIGF